MILELISLFIFSSLFATVASLKVSELIANAYMLTVVWLFFFTGSWLLIDYVRVSMLPARWLVDLVLIGLAMGSVQYIGASEDYDRDY